jgi:succinylglutamic semialdehyde dehydrogenase
MPYEEFQGPYIGGSFRKVDEGTQWINLNPAELKNAHFKWFENPALVEEAIEHGHQAFQAWSNLDLKERKSLLLKLSTEIEKRQIDISKWISLETGKAHWESQAEAKGLCSKIDITCNKLFAWIEQIENAFNNPSTQEMLFKPRGLCAVLGPFNFPLHLANGQIIPALLAGNTVIFKASEHSPMSAQIYAECFEKAGFPSSVFQLILGGAESGRRLVDHELVKGVFFTGSYAVGKKITQRLIDTRRDLSTIAALEMGGKNASILFEDCDYEKALAETLMSSYITSGQRCSCSSRIFVQSSIFEKFRKDFLQKAKALSFGKPFDESSFYGTMIHPDAVQSYQTKLEEAQDQGLKVLLQSEVSDSNSCAVSPALYQSTDPEKDTLKQSLQEELFGPQSTLIPFDSHEELVELHERAPYGLVSSIFSKDESRFKELQNQLEVGLLNFNRSTVGASSSLPFGGPKRSGNNWPAGIFAYFASVRPLSSLRDPTGFELSKMPKSLQHLWEKQ